eukprot:COSAG02_NODE_1066_length_14828_cov_8.021794_6_plen_108_part_00
MALCDTLDVGLCLVGSVPLPDMVAEIALLREMALTCGTEAKSPAQARAKEQAVVMFQALPEAVRTIESVDDLLAIEPWSMIFGGEAEDYSQAVRNETLSKFRLHSEE